MKFSDLPERKLSSSEKRKRETNVKKLKKHKGDFEKRYGKDAESVMYAVATKRAKGESVETEGHYLLPPMDREKYQDREGLEGPIMTRSGKVVYYDPKAGDYYDPDTDMYISYDDFRMLDKEGMYKVESEKRWKSTSLSYDDAVAKYGKDNVKKGMYKLRNGDDDIQVFVEWGGDDQYEATERAIEDALSMFDDMLDKGEDELRARAEAHEYLKGELQDYGVTHGDYESKHAHGELEKEIVQIMNYRDKGGRANEAKDDDPISAFDPETQAQLKDLKARYPHAPDQLSAVLKALVDIKKASKGQDDELGTDVDSNEERIKGLEARVDKLEKEGVGEAKKPAPDHNMRARMRAQEKIRKALAKKKDDKEPVKEAKLSPEQRKELDGLIDMVKWGTSPSTYDPDASDDAMKALKIIRSKFGDKVADQVADGIHDFHFPRHGMHPGTYGTDRLARKTPTQIKKDGKIDARSAKSTKRDIKSNLSGMNKKDPKRLGESLEEAKAKGLHQIDWPDVDEDGDSAMAQHAENAIRHGMHAYDAYGHVYSMTPERDWLEAHKDELIQMFAGYGLQTEGFASDAQRKAAFANGYDPKKKKKKESIDALESQLQEMGADYMTEEQFDEAAGKKDACYHKVKSRYKVWPSAYASGALVQCRKKGAKNWGNSKKK